MQPGSSIDAAFVRKFSRGWATPAVDRRAGVSLAKAEPGYPQPFFENIKLVHIYQYVENVMGGLLESGSMLAEILLTRREADGAENSARAGLIAAFELVSVSRSV
jgi:hypothetical protein